MVDSLVSKILYIYCALFICIINPTLGNGHKYCLPQESCWPKAEEWDALNKQVSGKLIAVKSFLDPCKTDSTSPACKAALKDAQNPFFLESRPDATESTGYFNAWVSSPSQYAIAAESPENIAAGVNFAKKHNIKLVIKGTGHDYLGRSNAPDSLLIWTHNMRDIKMTDSFVPQGCGKDVMGIPAVTVGAGTRWLETYDAVTNKGDRYVQGGGCTSVGAAGGFPQGGGFGHFSKKFGTGASNMLEAEVVTADGKILTANACQNQDLFWALKGGGGGTYGIVTKLTYKTHDLPQNFGIYEGEISANSDQAFKDLIEKFIHFYRDHLQNEHWGEQVHVNSDNKLQLILFFQGLNQEEVETLWKPFLKTLNQKDYKVRTNITIIPAQKMWNYEFIKSMERKNPDSVYKASKEGVSPYWWWTLTQGEVSEYWSAYKSRWIPSKLIESDHAGELAKVLFEASRHWDLGLHINKGLAGASKDALERVQKTSMNPKVLESSLLVILGPGKGMSFPGIKGYEPDMKRAAEQAQKAEKAIKIIRDSTPGAGSYINEADYFEPDWQNSFWGVNYPKLLEIKQKYDPDNLFTCHHCVGSE